jgi:uncharacterized protein with GYD domain
MPVRLGTSVSFFPGDYAMATFLMFGKYSAKSLKAAGEDRTKEAIDTIKQFKGRVETMYATLGPNDLVMVAEFPDATEAMKASIALMKQTGIAFTTSPAVTVDVFDKLLADV